MNPIQHYLARNAEYPPVRNALRGRSLNKSTLAELANVGYSVVHRTDMMLYDAIPPKLLKFMTDYDDAPTVDYATEYLAYKQDKLHFYKEYMEHNRDTALWLFKDPGQYSQTWLQWRSENFSTLMEFCKVILINPNILQAYEDGTTKNLPVVVKERLLYYGMKPEYVSTLSQFPRG